MSGCGCGQEIIAQYKEMVCVLGVSFVGGAVHAGLSVGSLWEEGLKRVWVRVQGVGWSYRNVLAGEAGGLGPARASPS
ncbi:hypothetical protein ACRRTK_007417 [Alexandromys fortis]